jgi:hypothetical protein
LKKTLLALSALAVSAFGGPINSSTATGWQVSTTGATGTFAAVVNEVGTPIFPTGWVANPVGSEWIGTSATSGQFLPGGTGAPGTYVYRLAIGPLLGSQGLLNFRYAADNAVNFWLGTAGGTLISTLSDCGAGDGNAGCFTALSAPVISTFAATDYLYATVVNGGTGPNPTGLLVVGSTEVVPEPSTYAMLALGGLAVGIARLRRK